MSHSYEYLMREDKKLTVKTGKMFLRGTYQGDKTFIFPKEMSEAYSNYFVRVQALARHATLAVNKDRFTKSEKQDLGRIAEVWDAHSKELRGNRFIFK